ncbi:uncharacterized protein LOC110032408 [Phalaenopsis equestris]|uniref:uncharacterized protein LOC110032408 n=1 Tax=Phalaenopsis equestris TaxID=78828 RepID=UPI0009E46EFF|nr:uncharacterized protein LOC110032408 [Phalaenopsis equestris]
MRVRIFFSNTPLLNFLPQPHQKASLVLWHCFSAFERPSPPPSFVMALRRHRVCGLLAGLAFLLFFSTAIGFCLGGIVQKEETSFMRRENAAAGRRLLAEIADMPVAMW